MDTIQLVKQLNTEEPVYHLQMDTSTTVIANEIDAKSRSVQYYQYSIPMNDQPQQHQQYHYQQSVVSQQERLNNDDDILQENSNQSNLISIPLAYERPMMLNAWSQTRLDDFPLLSRGSENEVEKLLRSRIKDLEATLKSQNEIILKYQQQQIVPKTRSPSPRQDIPNSTTSTPVSTKTEGTRYRILAQGSENKISNDSQIEIELSEQAAGMSSLNSSDDSSDRLEICMSDENEPMPLERPDLEHATVSIGPNGTKIPVKIYENMSWSSPSLATRKLLSLVFDRETLATHSMTGKASPAFKDQDKPIKGKLDPNAIQDIIFIVSRKCGVSPKEIRSAITTKCADENKMCKLKALKKLEHTTNATRTALKEILKNKTNRLNDNKWMK